MVEQTVVELEPGQHRHRYASRDRSTEQLKKAELSSIMCADTLVLATAVGKVVLDGMAWREKRKLQRLVLIIAGVAVSLTGLTGLAMQFLKN